MSWNCRNGQVPDPRPMGTWTKCPCACHRLGSERIAADCACQRMSTPENVECPTCQGVGSSWEDHVGNCPDCNGTGRVTTENVEEPT